MISQLVKKHFTTQVADNSYTGELGYDGLNGTRKIGPSYANPSYAYDTYLICMGLGPSILSVIDKSPSYSGPSYPSSTVFFILKFSKKVYLSAGQAS